MLRQCNAKQRRVYITLLCVPVAEERHAYPGLCCCWHHRYDVISKARVSTSTGILKYAARTAAAAAAADTPSNGGEIRQLEVWFGAATCQGLHRPPNVSAPPSCSSIPFVHPSCFRFCERARGCGGRAVVTTAARASFATSPSAGVFLVWT